MVDIRICNCRLSQKEGIYKVVDIIICNGIIEHIIDKSVEVIDSLEINERIIIDASGLYVMCGFIDNHSHTDEACFNPMFQSKISQGITTEICGNCGGSPAPISSEHAWMKRKQIKIIEDQCYTNLRWKKFSDYFALIDSKKAVCNQVSLAGWWTIFDDCMLKGENGNKMLLALEEAFLDGCRGVSINQSSNSWTSLSKELKKEIFALINLFDNTVFSVHLSDYSNKFLESVDEIHDLSLKYNTLTIYSHMKFCGKTCENNYSFFTQFINENNVYFDIYPFNSICTRLSSLLNEFKKKIITLKIHTIILNKKRLKYEVSMSNDIELIEYLLKEQLKNEGDALVEVKCIDENAMTKLLYNDKCLIGTDYSSCPITQSDRTQHHLRAFDTFTKSIDMFLEKGISIYEINQRLSTIPANIWNIRKRGKLEIGYIADIVLLSLNDINKSNVQYVILNGELVFSQSNGFIKKNGVSIRP